MPRVQLALNASDIDDCGRLPHQAARHQASQAPFRLRQLRDRQATADARAAGEHWQWRTLNHLGIEVPGTAWSTPTTTGLAPARSAGHDPLLRQAGQVLGRRRAGWGSLGDLHGPGGAARPLRARTTFTRRSEVAPVHREWQPGDIARLGAWSTRQPVLPPAAGSSGSSPSRPAPGPSPGRPVAGRGDRVRGRVHGPA